MSRVRFSPSGGREEETGFLRYQTGFGFGTGKKSGRRILEVGFHSSEEAVHGVFFGLNANG